MNFPNTRSGIDGLCLSALRSLLIKSVKWKRYRSLTNLCVRTKPAILTCRFSLMTLNVELLQQTQSCMSSLVTYYASKQGMWDLFDTCTSYLSAYVKIVFSSWFTNMILRLPASVNIVWKIGRSKLHPLFRWRLVSDSLEMQFSEIVI